MFIVYSKPYCRNCDRAKELLTQGGLSFSVVHLDVGQKKNAADVYISREELLEKLPFAKSMPQIMTVTGELIGGFTDLQNYLAKE